MYVLEIIHFVLLGYLSWKSHKFSVVSYRNRKPLFSSKCCFLNHKNTNFTKNFVNNSNVYNIPEDSSPKEVYLLSNYSEYLESNTITEIPPKSESVKNFLGMETSFDDTCMTVMRSDEKVLSEERLTHKDVLAQFGGLKPDASRVMHNECVDRLCDKVIRDSGLDIGDIDAIAVTRGPGNELCLREGYKFARKLSDKYGIPLFSENHIAAHCLSPMMRDHQYKYGPGGQCQKSKDLKYPYLCLLLSGAHSQMYLVENPLSFHLLSDAVDRHAGNVLDRCARELGFPPSEGGGAQLERAAGEVSSSRYNITLPRTNSHNLQFRFANIEPKLKELISEVLDTEKVPNVQSLPREIINELAFATQSCVFDVVMEQLEKALTLSEILFTTRQMVLVGGVARNRKLKEIIADFFHNRDHSQVVRRQRTLLNKISGFIRGLSEGFNLSTTNPYLSLYESLRGKIGSVEELVQYLCSSDLIPDQLKFDNMKKVRITDHKKNELYGAILRLYFSLLGEEDLDKIKHSLSNVLKKEVIVKPSNTIISLIREYMRPKNSSIVGWTDPKKKWELFSTSDRYATDNAPMIVFSHIEKLRMGITGVNDPEEVDGKDVFPKWNLGDRICWELLADICRIDSLRKFD